MDSAKYLVRELALPISAEEYLAERNALLRERFAACDAMPGAEKLVRHLHKHNVPIAVATSSGRDLYDIKTARHKSWFALFDTIVTGDDPAIKNGKPAPDIFLLAAARLSAPADATIVFEDSPLGIQAATAANLKSIAIPDPNMQKSRYTDADLIINSLTEFPLQRYGLPEY